MYTTEMACCPALGRSLYHCMQLDWHGGLLRIDACKTITVTDSKCTGRYVPFSREPEILSM